MTEENKKELCNEIELLIDEQLDGMISLSDKQKMENHIADCKDCKEYLKNTLESINQLDELSSKFEILSASEKENIWENVNSSIDFNEHFQKSTTEENLKISSYSVFRKKYYWISGIAAVIALFFIIYAVKNWSFLPGNDSLEYSFGLPTYWKVVNLKGNPKIGDMNFTGSDSIKEGQWIVTDSNSIAELIISDIGKVTIEPGSKVIFVNGADSSRKIFVEYGMINTVTDEAKKDPLMIEIPSAVAENLGGSYSMKIDKKGDGLIFVKSGKVDVESINKVAIVPAGNIVMTKNGIGVGTPFNEKASTKFRNALFDYDFGNCNEYCVNVLLDNAKYTDAVSLVNILNGKPVEPKIKDEIYNKIVNYVPPSTRSKNDSLKYFDEKELEIWIDDIQKKIEIDLKGSMDQLEKNLSEYKQDIHQFYFDSAKFYFLPENFEIPKIPNIPKVIYNYEYGLDTNYFDSEEFKEEMEKVKEEIKKSNEYNKEELNKEMEELNKEMEELSKELKEAKYFDSEEFKEEMEKVKEEMEKVKEEMEKVKEYNDNYRDYEYDHENPPGFHNTPEDVNEIESTDDDSDK